jgi:hypothetical protein
LTLVRSYLTAGDIRLTLPVNLYTAQWAYQDNVASTDTIGGRVVQLLSVQITDLSVTSVAGGRRELQKVADGIKSIMNFHIKTQRPARFVVPSRAWHMSVYVRAMPQIGWDVAATTYPYQLSLAILDDISGVKTKQVSKAALNRLSEGIGYNPAVHGGNTPAFQNLVDTVLKLAPETVGAGGGAGGPSATPGQWGGNNLWQPDVSNAPWTGNSLQDQIFNAWAAVFGSKPAHDALCVIQRESGFNPRAVNHNTNGSYDYGLFQINTIHRGKPWWPQDATITGQGGALWNAEYNTRCAMMIYKQSGWAPWYTAPQCGL